MGSNQHIPRGLASSTMEAGTYAFLAGASAPRQILVCRSRLSANAHRDRCRRMLRVGAVYDVGKTERLSTMNPLLFPYVVICRHCGHPIRLPGAMLLRLCDDLANPPKDEPPTVVGCPECKSASIYDHFDRPGYEENFPSIPQAYRTTLDCGKPGCGLSLPVIVATGEDRYREEIGRWTYTSEVRCPSGHLFAPQTKTE